MSLSAPAPLPSARRTNVPLTAIIGYGMGNFAFALLGLVVAVNLQFFYTDYVELSAGLVSWALLLARLFDAFADPLMGYASDRTQTRWGRRRPYIVGSALPLGVAFYYLFAPPVVADPAQHQGLLMLYMATLYTLTYFIWTVGAIPYCGGHRRPLLSGIALVRFHFTHADLDDAQRRVGRA